MISILQTITDIIIVAVLVAVAIYAIALCIYKLYLHET